MLDGPKGHQHANEVSQLKRKKENQFLSFSFSKSTRESLPHTDPT